MEHTFAICAYKDSPYLEACIKSLKAQEYKSKIIMISSTPSKYLYDLADKYKIAFFINEQKKGLANDWNFAYEKADTELVTIAHQDDIYLKNYTKNIIFYKKKYPDMSLFTCGAKTINQDQLIKNSLVDNIKILLRLPLKLAFLNKFSFIKRLAISFGNPIICPSCCYSKSLCKSPLFNEKFNFVTDWEALIRLSKDKNRWICVEKELIYYRVHNLSATKYCLENNIRQKEEKIIFESLWGSFISKILLKFYRRSYLRYDK